jgi:hypothetical protein
MTSLNYLRGVEVDVTAEQISNPLMRYLGMIADHLVKMGVGDHHKCMMRAAGSMTLETKLAIIREGVWEMPHWDGKPASPWLIEQINDVIRRHTNDARAYGYLDHRIMRHVEFRAVRTGFQLEELVGANVG